jgi:hypothetical protein
MTDGQSAILSWFQAPTWGPIRFLLLSDSCDSLMWAPSLTRGQFVVYGCCWPSPARSVYRLLLKIVGIKVTLQLGRAIAQAVSRRFPTAAARVQTRVWSSGIL